MKQKFITGFILGALLFGTVGVFAGQYVATENPFPIKLNGQNVNLEGYSINDSTYFKLRDIGKEVGFDVDFNDSTILITTEEGSMTESGQDLLKYETISGVEYISAKDADSYIFALGDFFNGDCWSFAYSNDEHGSWSDEGGSWGYLNKTRNANTIEEYKIPCVFINGTPYLTREVFENEILSRVNQK